MMVQQLKEDQAGKSEEELSECFRVFDKCVSLSLNQRHDSLMHFGAPFITEIDQISISSIFSVHLHRNNTFL